MDMLEASVANLDPVISLLALVQISGDRSLLEEHGPALRLRPGDKNQTMFTGERRAEAGGDDSYEKAAAQVRSLLVAEMKAGAKPLLPSLDIPLFSKMAELAAGRPLPDVSVGPAYQHSGFTTDTRVRRPRNAPPADFKVLVIGAGMMGINAGVKLQQAGFNFTILEKHGDVGGNWLETRYPGAAVDTPSRSYSYSFDPNPNWTRFYPTGPEFLRYIQDITNKYRLRPHIQFGVSVQGADWDEASSRWVVEARRGDEAERYEADFVIWAVGPNNAPNFPDVEDLDRFQGPVMHTARWDPDVDLAGKKVVLVGSACSGVQVATAIADQVGDLTIVQRQPEYIVPNPLAHTTVDPLERWALENIPFVHQWLRFQAAALSYQDLRGLAVIDEDYRARTGGASPLSDMIKRQAMDYLDSHFGDDPAMKAELTPSYPPFAKRIIHDCGFFDTVKKPHVRLLSGAMQRADENAVILADGRRLECDAILLATGYKLMFGRQFDIRGRNGSLRDAFDPYPFSYLGLLVPGFPNMVYLGGPYSHLVANHAVVSEQQVHYTIELLQWMVDDQLASLDVSREAADRFVSEVDAELSGTVWANSGDAHGYYRDQGKKVVIGIARHNSHIWHDTRSPRAEDFEIKRKADARDDEVEPAVRLSM
ncbi:MULTISPECIES: NAD(P)/FAD-dependent oxidoreductase [unclassified Sphingobium]|uniref:NAD(P)/FAD-dependent oxidoreductase n=1 Tax=unclassified Sphingobium TaxID=2611147 RepID=UPI001919D02B|nr:MULTISPECIES: NAD(P)/FAD-dependent oxidoreductase [unclassified Sphingobium]CAD7337216.1 4-hydroxyacetophenone monooxygenase [Sphingobium sp. S6]CAD7337245.1 4-hydroxyacetophenone monooxygenase [Sphingobium sp. S8]